MVNIATPALLYHKGGLVASMHRMYIIYTFNYVLFLHDEEIKIIFQGMRGDGIVGKTEGKF